VRYLSFTIDTLLLAAALMLTTILQQYPFVESWLTMKVMLVLVCICLGYIALRRATKQARWASLGGAALVYGFIVTIARSHSPLGILT
jgi:uncharacterized membrane protein SirB2